MGLRFSHGTANWGYVGFMAFREKLAKQIGINLKEMIGFGGNTKWDMESDPINSLLNHSDCDGKLTPKECKIIAPRLRELIAEWEDNSIALELAEGMEEAASVNEFFIFT